MKNGDVGFIPSYGLKQFFVLFCFLQEQKTLGPVDGD